MRALSGVIGGNVGQSKLQQAASSMLHAESCSVNDASCNRATYSVGNEFRPLVSGKGSSILSLFPETAVQSLSCGAT